MNKVIINKGYQNILKDYSNTESYEMCAMLIGNGEQVNHIYFTDNIEKSPVHFTIPNEQLINGYKKAAQMNMDVIGIFHSHPTLKVPRTLKRREMFQTFHTQVKEARMAHLEDCL